MATEQGSSLEIIIVGIDCVEPKDSRLKVYLRSPHTSFSKVCETITLGNTLDTLADETRANLKDLWRLTLGLPSDFSEHSELHSKDHQTAGILYYFDIQINGSGLQPKLYIPVRHYATNDASAANGLGMYLRSRQQDARFPDFMRVLQRTCTHRTLDMHSGYQTYIGTSFKKDGSLSLCSYINGEAYHPDRIPV